MGSTNIITALLQAGANIEYPDLKGNTALLLACGGRHLGAMDELLEKGANPNARDLQGRTALMLLCVLGEDEMVRILLKYKADISLVDHSMRSALSYAREYRRKACIAILEQSGAKY
jgi:ankyrin repeat protein